MSQLVIYQNWFQGAPKKRVAACAALNRTCSLIKKVGGNQLLIQLLNEGVIDR
jgi:hypothetical protein